MVIQAALLQQGYRIPELALDLKSVMAVPGLSRIRYSLRIILYLGNLFGTVFFRLCFANHISDYTERNRHFPREKIGDKADRFFILY